MIGLYYDCTYYFPHLKNLKQWIARAIAEYTYFKNYRAMMKIL